MNAPIDPAPPPYFGAQAIRTVLRFAPLIAHLRQAHRQPVADVERVLMLHKTASGTENGFLVWPAWQHGSHLGIKICTMFPDNRALPTVQALYLLFSGSDGSVQALMDGTELTYWKTAADSALAADYLARPDAQTLLMVGAGRLAPHLVRAYRAIRPGLQNILVWNRTASKAEQLARDVDGRVRARAVTDLEAAVRQADIVCCATTSFEPLVRGAWLRAGTHLDLIGGYTPDMRETDDDAVRRAKVYVDSRWFTVAHAGDLSQPIAAGVLSAQDIVGDLFDLCSGRCPARENPTAITLFKSGGGAHLDLMTAQHAMARLTASVVLP